MRRLLDFEDWKPVLKTDARETVGVYLHWNGSVNKPVLTLDLVNYDFDVETSQIKPTSPLEITLQLPKWLAKKQFDVTAFDPELDGTGQKVRVEAKRISGDRLLLHVPSFRFYSCVIVM